MCKKKIHSHSLVRENSFPVKIQGDINRLITKLFLPDLKTRFLPRSKHSLLPF